MDDKGKVEASFKSILGDVVGKVKLTTEDPKWSELFKSTREIFSLSGGDEKTLYYFRKLSENGLSSSNFVILLQHTTSKLRQVRTNIAKRLNTSESFLEQLCCSLHLSALLFNYLFSIKEKQSISFASPQSIICCFNTTRPSFSQ